MQKDEGIEEEGVVMEEGGLATTVKGRRRGRICRHDVHLDLPLGTSQKFYFIWYTANNLIPFTNLMYMLEICRMTSRIYPRRARHYP